MGIGDPRVGWRIPEVVEIAPLLFHSSSISGHLAGLLLQIGGPRTVVTKPCPPF